MNMNQTFGKKTKQIKTGIIFIKYQDFQEPMFLIVYSRKSKKFGFPKGTFEKDKDGNIFESAKREIYEETGIKLIPNLKLDLRFQVKNNIYFILKLYKNINSIVLSQSTDIPDSNEIQYYKWVSLSDLKKIPSKTLNLGLKTYIKDVLLQPLDDHR